MNNCHCLRDEYLSFTGTHALKKQSNPLLNNTGADLRKGVPGVRPPKISKDYRVLGDIYIRVHKDRYLGQFLCHNYLPASH